MAKLLGDFFGGRRPGFTGRLIVDNYRGVRRVRAWPKKRGKVKSPLQQFWVDWFKTANFLAKYASSSDIRRAKELTQGTAWYPRDILIRAMRGRLFYWTDETGKTFYPVAALSDISDTLDVLAQEIGNILVRAADRWRAPADGAEADVLTYHPLAPPDWQPIPVAPPAPIATALMTRTGALSVPRITAFPMQWQTADEDTDGFIDFGVSNQRFTIPAGFAWCRLTCGIIWQGGGVGYRRLNFSKNGAAFAGAGMNHHPVVTFGNMQALTSALVPCVEGDYFEAVVNHNHSTTWTVNSNNDITFFGIQAFA